MKYYLRLLWLVLTQRRRERCTLLGPCVTSFRVMPNDLDVFMHMNNGAYFTIADLGRTDLLLRSNAFGRIRERGWYPVVAGETIRFRRSLKLFERYTITTRVIAWNERSVYIEQVFERTGTSGTQAVATALIDARFLSTSGERIGTAQLLDVAAADDALGFDGSESSPAMPPWVESWVASMQHM